MGPGLGRDLPDQLRVWQAGRADHLPACPAPHHLRRAEEEQLPFDCWWNRRLDVAGYGPRCGSREVASRAEAARKRSPPSSGSQSYTIDPPSGPSWILWQEL